MTFSTAIRERDRIEETLSSLNSDFGAVYMSVHSLCRLLAHHPDAVSFRTLHLLGQVWTRPSLGGQKQAYFLYRLISEALVAVLTGTAADPLREGASRFLKHAAEIGSGRQQRAAAEALGSLPILIQRPEIENSPPKRISRISAEAFFRKRGFARPAVLGRSLVAFPAGGSAGRPLVLKVAAGRSGLKSLTVEAAWMRHLQQRFDCRRPRFDLPEPVRSETGPLFELTGPPAWARRSNLPAFALGFHAPRDYFRYPNDHRPRFRMGEALFQEVLIRNARLLGSLTADGIVHTAPIPLFHNRVQAGRRADAGHYHWWRGGRLDRWLHSCRYPNFGASGVRDFEHFVPFDGSLQGLFRSIGSHLLSLVLVAASYFRHRKPDRIGRDADGRPVDVREVFDIGLLRKLLRDVFRSYYRGFVGNPLSDTFAVDLNRLALRMTEEMGVDRHMDEMLRVQDQRVMDDPQFRDFLVGRGISEQEAARLVRGKEDLALPTGPHLGGFNRPISLPELIEYVGAAAGCCIAGRFRKGQAP